MIIKVYHFLKIKIVFNLRLLPYGFLYFWQKSENFIIANEIQIKNPTWGSEVADGSATRPLSLRSAASPTIFAPLKLK